MRRNTRKSLSILFTLAMAVGLLPLGQAAFAASGDAALVMGTASVLGDASDYNQTTGTQIVRYGGQRWCVVGYNGAGVAGNSGTMTLISVGILKEGVRFSANSNRYGESDLKGEVEAVANSFSTGEQAAVQARTLWGYSSYGSPGYNADNIAGDPVYDALLWPLSVQEANALNRELCKADQSFNLSDLHYWWLRTGGESGKAAMVVAGSGVVNPQGVSCAVYVSYGVRPAFYVNLDSVLFSSAAEGGKLSGAAGADALNPVGTNSGDEWKLTVKDASRDDFFTSSTSYDSGTGMLQFSYSGAGTGSNEFVSVIVTDSTGATIKQYGRVVANSAFGTASVNLAGKLDSGDRVFAFSEQYNGNNNTDYASELKELPLTPPTVTTTALPSGKVGNAYTATLSVSGTAPFTWSAAGLPAGLSIDSSTGEISGTPTADGTFTVSVTATNSFGSNTKTFALTIDPASASDTAPAVTTLALPFGRVRDAYATMLSASGTAPITWSATGLPAGLSIGAATGTFSGTPTEGGTFAVSVTATNGAGSDTKAFTLTIYPASTPANGDAALVKGTASVLGDASDYNQTTGTQIVHYGGQSWYVVGYDGAGVAGSSGAMTLIPVENLKGDVPFRADYSSDDACEYGKSDLKGEVEAVADSFSAGERAAIRARTLEGGSGTLDNRLEYDANKISGDPVDDALLWPLSVQEANAMNADLRMLGPSNTDTATNPWWLRSPGTAAGWKRAGVVYGTGQVQDYGTQVQTLSGLRPAFYLNLNSVLFSSAAEGGKFQSAAGADALTFVGAKYGDEWKLTLSDSGRDGFSASLHKKKDGKVTVSYSGATVGANEYISAIITNSAGDVTYYGRLCAAESGDNKTATVDVRNKMNEGDTLYVFNEQYNGDNMTDYASPLREIDPNGSTTTSIEDAEVVLSKTAFTYNGKAQKPTIKTIGGKALVAGTDYTVVWSSASSKNVGTYTVTITGEGEYEGTTRAVYKINKAANPLAAKGKTAKIKYAKLKKKAQKLAVAKVIKLMKKGQGTMKYTLSSAKKGKKSFKKYFKVNAKTGKVTVKKGPKKGTYKVKVKVNAAGNSNYKASGLKTVTFKVKIK